MIQKASIRNFKCLRDVQVDLERFTIIVGPNASGKSSILQALDLLCQSYRKPTGQENVRLSAGQSRGATESVQLAATDGERWYRFQTGKEDPNSRRGRGAPWSGVGRGVALEIDSPDWKPWPSDERTTPPLPTSVLLRLEAMNLVPANVNQQDPSAMAPDGTGLHSALADMALNEPDSWQRLQDDLRRIIPTIRRLRHSKRKTAHEQPALLFDTVGGDSLRASHVSEGTLLVLGLLTALYAPDRPNLILLDDIDRGLHPKAQRDLVGLLRELMANHAELQIIASTHSPFLLDCVTPEEVRMTFLRDDGSTVCAPLTDHPKFQTWKDEMSPGEMWSLFGEKWVAEQEVAG